MLGDILQPLTLGAVCIALCVSTTARADSVYFVSDGSIKGQGSFEGQMTYTVKDGKSFGKLILSLTNTSNPSNGGYLTGIVFNFDSMDPAASAVFKPKTASHPFKKLSGAGLNAKSFGNGFDAGIAVGKKFAGSGKAKNGIATGETGKFVFRVNSTDFASLTAASFLQGPFNHNFVARFRNFNQRPNDFAYVSSVPIPVPAAALLGAAGLIGIVGLRHRKLARLL